MKSVLNATDRSRLLGRIDALRPGMPARWGRMSAHGMVCHLTDSFDLVLGHRSTARTGTLLERTLVRLLALTLPLPWPRGVPTVTEVDQEQGGTPPAAFEADVERLRTAFDEFVARVPRQPMRHPMMGQVSKAEWGRWGYRHVDHHLRQFRL
jgi:hypothetical protein